MYLIYDTETTGLPSSWDAPPSDVENWPRAVQVAWQVFDRQGKRGDVQCHIIRPQGFTIPQEAVHIHGITTSIAKRHGVQLNQVLRMYARAAGEASVLVAHNASFDAGVLSAEFFRVGKRPPFGDKVQVCTMKSSTQYCALPGNYGFKWPKLSELYHELFGKPLRREHHAGADVTTCARCFFELMRLGIVRIPCATGNIGNRINREHG